MVGGVGAVPTAKLSGRDMTRLSGADRWVTAQLVGRFASGDVTAGTSTALEPDESIDSEDDSQEEAVDELLLGDDFVSQETETLNGTGNWWLQPRGDLAVNVHVCVEQGLERHFAQSDLVNYAQHYNRAIAPFYSWQSSGLLKVRFQPGEIIVSSVAAEAQSFDDWGSVVAPIDCLSRLPSSEPHIAHAMIVYDSNEQVRPDAGGRGGGGLGTTFIRHFDGLTAASAPLSSYYRFVVRHKLDYAFGFPHYYARAKGHIRVHIVRVRHRLTRGA